MGEVMKCRGNAVRSLDDLSVEGAAVRLINRAAGVKRCQEVSRDVREEDRIAGRLILVVDFGLFGDIKGPSVFWIPLFTDEIIHVTVVPACFSGRPGILVLGCFGQHDRSEGEQRQR